MEYGRISPEWENNQSATLFSDFPISLYRSCAWSKVLFKLLPPFVFFAVFENYFHFSALFWCVLWKLWKWFPNFMKNTFTIPILAHISLFVNTFLKYFLCKSVRLNILNILCNFHKNGQFLKFFFIFSSFLVFEMKIWNFISFTFCSNFKDWIWKYVSNLVKMCVGVSR